MPPGRLGERRVSSQLSRAGGRWCVGWLLALLVLFATPLWSQLPTQYEVTPQAGWKWASLRGKGPPVPELVDYVNQSLSNIRTRLDRQGPAAPLIVYCPNRSWFEKTTRAFGGATPHPWAAALAFPSRGVILIDGGRRSTTAPHEYLVTLSHELVHVVLGVGLGAVPRWYHEGVAQHFSDDVLEEEKGALISAWAHEGDILPLAELDRYLNRSHQRASDFYRQSFSFVRYVCDRHGEGVHGKLVKRVEAGTPFATAFEEVVGKPLLEVEAQWHAWLAAQFSFVRWFIGLLRPFSFLAMLCAIGFLFQKLRRRRQLRRMATEEDGEPPGEEYWRVE